MSSFDDMIKASIAQVAVEYAISKSIVRMFTDKRLSNEAMLVCCTDSKELCRLALFHDVSEDKVDDFILEYYHDKYVLTFEERHAKIKASIEAAMLD